MRPNIPLSRAAAVVVLVSLLGTAGCSWFRKTDDLYVQAPENRPLEVPPDLDRPRTEGAVGVPTGSVTASGTVAAASGSAAPAPASTTVAGVAPAPVAAAQGTASGFNIPGTRDDAFARVDTALAGIEGVTVASRAKLLGVFDVNYQDVNFLVRVSDVEAGAYISAVDPRGMPASGPAPSDLIEQLKAALGAN